jgi:hypothetical protein
VNWSLIASFVLAQLGAGGSPATPVDWQRDLDGAVLQWVEVDKWNGMEFTTLSFSPSSETHRGVSFALGFGKYTSDGRVGWADYWTHYGGYELSVAGESARVSVKFRRSTQSTISQKQERIDRPYEHPFDMTFVIRKDRDGKYLLWHEGERVRRWSPGAENVVMFTRSDDRQRTEQAPRLASEKADVRKRIATQACWQRYRDILDCHESEGFDKYGDLDEKLGNLDLVDVDQVLISHIRWHIEWIGRLRSSDGSPVDVAANILKKKYGALADATSHRAEVAALKQRCAEVRAILIERYQGSFEQITNFGPLPLLK